MQSLFSEANYPHPPASFQSKLFTNIKVKELRASAMCFDE